VKVPWTACESLGSKEWNAVRLRASFNCYKWDLQSEDRSVLADFPMVIDAQEWRLLANLAEKLAAEAMEAEQELVRRPALHSILGLTRRLRKALPSAGAKDAPVGCARVVRFDFHFTTEGWRISEANSDVPGGFIESSGFTELLADHHPQFAAPENSTDAYASAIAAAADESGVIGLVHATAHSDDAQVMHYLAQRLKRKKLQPVLIGPNHLRWDAGVAKIACSFAEATPSVLVRFFPGEWLPNLRREACWKPWFSGGKTAMSNPGTAMLTQSKRFPLVWKELDAKLDTWRALLPETKCPSELRDFSADWVLKPAFGRVGQDVAIAGVTEARALREIEQNARRRHSAWVAQRRFETLPLQTSRGIREVCLGVFTVGGSAAGVYGRIGDKPLIDHEAQDIAVLLRGKGRDDDRTRIV
jgi:glutathionylspermidine synthase